MHINITLYSCIQKHDASQDIEGSFQEGFFQMDCLYPGAPDKV